MKWIQPEIWADMGCGTDGQTDGRMEWNQYTPPPTTSLCGGYKNHLKELIISDSHQLTNFSERCEAAADVEATRTVPRQLCGGEVPPYWG